MLCALVNHDFEFGAARQRLLRDALAHRRRNFPIVRREQHQQRRIGTVILLFLYTAPGIRLLRQLTVAPGSCAKARRSGLSFDALRALRQFFLER